MLTVVLTNYNLSGFPILHNICIFEKQEKTYPFKLTMEDLTYYFETLINQNRSVDIAEAEFKRQLADDEELRRSYKEWCAENGTSEKRGFLDFCEDYLENQNSIWQSLNDYDE